MEYQLYCLLCGEVHHQYVLQSLIKVYILSPQVIKETALEVERKKKVVICG